MSYAYPAIMLLAVAAAAVLSRGKQARLGLNGWQRAGIGLGAFCGAMIGAKLPFVLSDWQGLRSGWAWFSDGKTIMTGLVGGYLGVELAKWALEVRVKTGDTFALPVAVGVAIGRVACFVGGCCYGAPTALPWGVVFPAVDNQPRHPTQLYEAAFHALAALALWQLQRRGLFRGQLIKLYLIAYLVYRFASEFLRPEPPLWGGLTGYQFAALALIPLFVFLWWRDARQLKVEHSSVSSSIV